MSMVRQCLQTLGHKSGSLKLRSKQSEYLYETGHGVLLQRQGECMRRGDFASIVIAQMMTQLPPDSFHGCFFTKIQMGGILDRTLNLAAVR